MGRERIHGPYKHRQRWRLIEVRGDGEESVVSFASREEAIAYKEAALRVAVGRTLRDAVTDYLKHLAATPSRDGGMRRASTLYLTGARLKGFLRVEERDAPLGCFDRAMAKRLFEQRRAETKVDTLISELALVRRWVRFWVEAGVLSADPTVGLVVMGDRSTGKPQLRVDEARKLLTTALDANTVGGDAVALVLLTGMRASELTGLLIRDLDDGGRLLWVEDNMVRRLKTRKRRQLEVPSLLQPRLLALAEGRQPTDRLFDDPTRPGRKPVDRMWLNYLVEKFCKLAGVPVVSPHGLRGTWASIARGAMPTEQVAATIGNLPKVSATNYIAPGVAASADTRRVDNLLTGGHHGTEVQMDSGAGGGRDMGGGRVRHDGRPSAADVGATPAVREHDVRAGGEGGGSAGPGPGGSDPGVPVGGGPAGTHGTRPSWVTVLDESLPASASLDPALYN